MDLLLTLGILFRPPFPPSICSRTPIPRDLLVWRQPGSVGGQFITASDLAAAFEDGNIDTTDNGMQAKQGEAVQI